MEIQHIAVAAYDNVGVARFYENVFGLTEVHRTYHTGNPGVVYLSDGRTNLAFLLAKEGRPEGIAHFGFKIDESQYGEIQEKAQQFGGRAEAELTQREGFVESKVFDPLGIGIDVATGGWRL